MSAYVVGDQGKPARKRAKRTQRRRSSRSENCSTTNKLASIPGACSAVLRSFGSLVSALILDWQLQEFWGYDVGKRPAIGVSRSWQNEDTCRCLYTQTCLWIISYVAETSCQDCLWVSYLIKYWTGEKCVIGFLFCFLFFFFFCNIY